MTVIVLARPSADVDTIPASSAYSMLPTALRTHASGSELTPAAFSSRFRAYPRRVLLKVLEVNQIPYNVWVLTETYHHGVCHSSEEYIEKKR